jgi:hypothetical protein
MKPRNEKEFKKFIMKEAENIANGPVKPEEMPELPNDGKTKDSRDVSTFEERFDKIKGTVQSIFNSINNADEFEQVLSYMVDEFKYVSNSAKLLGIRKVLAAKSKSDTPKV